MSAIFYTVDGYPEWVQRIFYLNPIYVFITYFRRVVISGEIPSLYYHLWMIGYSALVALIGALVYKKNNQKFLYYV